MGEIGTIFKSDKIECSFNLSRIGPPMGKPFEIRVISNDDQKRQKSEKAIRDFLAAVDGVSDVDTDVVEGKDELNLALDYDQLARTGLTVDDVLTTLRIAFDGQVVTSMVTLDRQIDFRLHLNRKGRRDINFIQNLPILNRYGNIINMKSFVSLKRQSSKAEYHHVDGKRSTAIFGNVDIDKISPIEVMKLVKKNFPGDRSVAISYSGQPVETELIFGDLSYSAGIALVGVFLLITLILNSFSKPLIIMAPLPFLLIGVAFALLTHGLPMAMLGGVAVVGLMGVVVNGSIVMVHTIDKISGGEGLTMEMVIDGAVSRLRPVLLTTVTTIFGVLPTAYGWGGYDPFLSQMCIVMAYGLLFGSMIVLFLVPILYNMGIDVETLLNKKNMKSPG